MAIDFIRRNFPSTRIKKRIGENADRLYLAIEGFYVKNNKRVLSENEALKIIGKAKNPIIKLHTYSWPYLSKTYPHWFNWMNTNGKIIYIARDVKSVMTSMHLYEQSFNVEARCTISEFIKQPYCGARNRIDYWNKQYMEWEKRPDTLVVNFTNIIKHPLDTISAIKEFTSIEPHIIQPPLPPKETNIWMSRLKKYLSTSPNSSAIIGYYKGQKTKKWQELFDKKDLEFIDKYAGEAMKKLRYL